MENTNADNAGYKCPDLHDPVPLKSLHTDAGIYHAAAYTGAVLVRGR